MKKQYTIVLEPDLKDGGFTVTVPALEGCITQGDDEAEARKMAADLIPEFCGVILADGIELPDDVKTVDLSGYVEGTFTRMIEVEIA